MQRRIYSVKFAESAVTLNGEEKTVAEWCAIKNLKIATVYRRRSKAYTWHEAFLPVQLRKDHLWQRPLGSCFQHKEERYGRAL